MVSQILIFLMEEGRLENGFLSENPGNLILEKITL